MYDVVEHEIESDCLEREVATHYGLTGLHKKILSNLAASGFDLENLRHEDLAQIDEFHMGGRPATEYIIGKLLLTGSEHVLDVGSGLGGPARCIASRFGCKVTGIDLTSEYVTIARDLTARTKLNDKVSYEVGSALETPFATGKFDAAINIHVAMNIRNRSGLYKEIARVLRPGAMFGVYDVMMGPNEGLHFPLHWAETPGTSHVISMSQTGALLGAAGFLIEHIEERKESALAFLHERLAALAKGTPLLGVHVLLGDNAREKIENMIRNLEEARATPVIMIVRRV
jgi:MPBQ/MSBQ methyltransferase